MGKEVVGSMLEWSGVLKDFFRQINDGTVQKEELQLFLERKNPFALVFSNILSNWEEYYKDVHQLKTDFAGIIIPTAEDIFSWLVCVPENFSTERAYSGRKKLYPKRKWTNMSLDDVIDLSFGRDAWANPHIVRFRSNWEADEDLKGLSANVIAERKINAITLRERKLLGDFLFWKNKKHLDINVVTLCAGSRYADGNVPSVNLNSNGDVNVNRYHPDYAFGVLRPRHAVP